MAKEERTPEAGLDESRVEPERRGDKYGRPKTSLMRGDEAARKCTPESKPMRRKRAPAKAPEPVCEGTGREQA